MPHHSADYGVALIRADDTVLSEDAFESIFELTRGLATGLFLAGDALLPESTLRERLNPAPLEMNSSNSPVAAFRAISRACQAVRFGECEVAVVICSTGPQVATVVLAGTGLAVSHRPLAWLRGCLAEDRMADPAGLLMETCDRLQLPASSVSLLNLCCRDAAQLPDLFLKVGKEIRRGGRALPHCNVALLRCGENSPVDALKALCSAARSLYERTLPAYSGAGSIPLESPFCGHPVERPWIGGLTQRAAVLATDGESAGALLLEHTRCTPVPPRRATQRPADLILFQAPTAAALCDQVAEIAACDTWPPPRAEEQAGGFRASIVAQTRGDLRTKCQKLLKHVVDSPQTFFHSPGGICFGQSAAAPPPLALLFPGQGSQYMGMMGDLCLTLPSVQAWFDRLSDTFSECAFYSDHSLLTPPYCGYQWWEWQRLEKRLWTVNGAFVSTVGSLALTSLLAAAGVVPEAMAGYSNGENAALVASGALRLNGIEGFYDALVRLSSAGVFENGTSNHSLGEAWAITTQHRELLDQLLDASTGRVFLALDNCPHQAVIFGAAEDIAPLVERLKSNDAVCARLPFLERGHHTPAFESGAAQLQRVYATFDFSPSAVSLYSAVTARQFPSSANAIRETAMAQWTQPIRFRHMIERMYADGIRTFVEVGPSAHLTSYVRSILRGKPYFACATNVAGRPGLEQLLKALGLLHVQGHNMNLDALLGRNDAPALPFRFARAAVLSQA